MTGPSVVWQHHTAAAASDRTSTVVGMTNALVSHSVPLGMHDVIGGADQGNYIPTTSSLHH